MEPARIEELLRGCREQGAALLLKQDSGRQPGQQGGSRKCCGSGSSRDDGRLLLEREAVEHARITPYDYLARQIEAVQFELLPKRHRQIGRGRVKADILAVPKTDES
jgi:hypothetical protein